MSGNRLGPKVRVDYVSDSGKTYNLRVDSDLVISNSGLVLGSTGGPPPKRWRPRGVFAQFPDPDTNRINRKFLICGTTAAALYASDTPATITIDGVVFTTTGRKGEKQSF